MTYLVSLIIIINFLWFTQIWTMCILTFAEEQIQLEWIDY